MTWKFGYNYGENLEKYQKMYDAIPYDKTEIDNLGQKHRRGNQSLHA